MHGQSATAWRCRVSDTGEGPAVVLLHGLTATRRYVVMGSTVAASAAATA